MRRRGLSLSIAHVLQLFLILETPLLFFRFHGRSESTITPSNDLQRSTYPAPAEELLAGSCCT